MRLVFADGLQLWCDMVSRMFSDGLDLRKMMEGMDGHGRIIGGSAICRIGCQAEMLRSKYTDEDQRRVSGRFIVV